LVIARRGLSSMGCLFSLAIAGALMYVGVKVGEVYWRYYEYQDDINQQVRFAAHTSNDQILVHLRAMADSLDLPEGAKEIQIRRTDAAIAIEVEYDDRIELPKYTRDVHFHPHAEGPL
jgi:hypothetical protein